MKILRADQWRTRLTNIFCFPSLSSVVKEVSEVADENSGNELDAEELQEKVKTQGPVKAEDEEQDLRV